jgi:general secretion pathway protein D
MAGSGDRGAESDIMRPRMTRKFSFHRSLIGSPLVAVLCACSTPGNYPPLNTEVAADVTAKEPTPIASSARELLTDSTKAGSKLSRAVMHKGTGVTFKTTEPDVPAAVGDISLDFEGADVREVAKLILGELLQSSYMVDPKVQGSVTFRTVRPLSKTALMPTLEALLRVNGAVLVQENGFFKILPAPSVRGSLSPKAAANIPGYSVQVIPLKFIGVREMAKILEPFAPEGSLLRIDDLRNLLIIAAGQNEMRHIIDTIDMFDVDWLSGMSVGLFTLQSSDVKSLALELDKVIGDKSASPLAGIVRIIPIERLNAFVVITPQAHYLEQAKLWIQRLDRGGDSQGRRVFVYQVQNGKAESLAALLTEAFLGTKTQPSAGQATASVAPGLTPATISSSPISSTSVTPALNKSATGATGTLGAVAVGTAGASGVVAPDVRIVADKENNSLLILASPGDYEQIESALRKLDVVPRQVLIEVMIAEVSLDDDMSLGIEWTFKGKNGSGLLDLGATGLARSTGFSYAYVDALTGGVKAMMNSLARDSRVNVLATPHIMVADKQTAKIQVGDSVPIAGPQSITNGTVTNSVQYVDTGNILTVVPHISAGGIVNLEITQEVSNASVTDTSSIQSPTISRRSAKTTLAVQSGDTTVLGGLISERRTFATSGVPLLSRIPLVGALFGNQGYRTQKTELIVLITPQVVVNSSQSKMVTDEIKRRMEELEGTFTRLRERDQRGLRVDTEQGFQ